VFHHLWNGLHKGSQHGERRTHPTEKPMALFEHVGQMFAPQGLWLDLYAGTGAQVLAAERAGATCYACEIEPLYVACLLERLADLGLTPRRVEAGRASA
jgi:DNA modification methylase